MYVGIYLIYIKQWLKTTKGTIASWTEQNIHRSSNHENSTQAYTTSTHDDHHKKRENARWNLFNLHHAVVKNKETHHKM